MSYKTSFKDGRLGIGLSTSVNSGAPKYPLDINGDIRLTGAILKSDGTVYTSGSGMGTPGIVSNQTDGVYKIGINNITPTVALDISGNGLITGDLQLNGTLKDSNGDPRIFSNWTIHSNGNDLYRPSGNVGIGTNSPRELLNISGSSSSATDILYPIMINNQAMHASSNIGGGVGIKFHMYDNANTEYRYSAIAGISEATYSNKTALAFYTNNSSSTAPLERMRIDNGGNVGIGEIAPTSKLTL